MGPKAQMEKQVFHLQAESFQVCSIYYFFSIGWRENFPRDNSRN